MNAPQLRFVGFESQLKEINLQKIIEFKNGLNYLKSDSGETVFTIGVKNFNKKKINSSTDLEVIQLNSLPNNEFKVEKEDLLFVRSNGNKELVGRMMYIGSELQNTYFSGFVIRGRIKDKGVLQPLYLLYLEDMIKAKIKYLTGGTNISNLSQSILNSISLNVPNIQEQKKISTFFTLLDQKIEKQLEKIVKLEELNKGMMQKIFSREIRFKDEDGAEFGEWEEKLLSGISIINPKSEPLNNEFYYIDLDAVDKGSVGVLKTVSLENAPSRAQRVLKEKDVLFQTVRPYQQNHFYVENLYDKQTVASTGFAQIRTKQNARYVYYLMHNETFAQKVMDRCTGTSYPAIKSGDLGEINVPVPTLLEQEKISGYLSLIEKKIKIEKEKLKMLVVQKKGFMQQMFV